MKLRKVAPKVLLLIFLQTLFLGKKWFLPLIEKIEKKKIQKIQNIQDQLVTTEIDVYQENEIMTHLGSKQFEVNQVALSQLTIKPPPNFALLKPDRKRARGDGNKV